MTPPPFVPFPKIARLRRECIITEKIDGTNAQVTITEDGRIFAGSRSRWITPESDNHGFAAWVRDHHDELLTLGPGSHFGEWWGSGIQRGYGLQKGEKRFSLFNVSRWCLHGATPERWGEEKMQQVLPPCCGLVPILYRGDFATHIVESTIVVLSNGGSHAAPGFMDPEGIVVYHTASGHLYKRTVKNDEVPKFIADRRAKA